MNSWVYLFSHFTAEALIFELLAIGALVCGYSFFWVLRKRRFGASGAFQADLPSGPVREYLGELIDNAEELRAQLFGLLSAGQAVARRAPAPVLVATPAPTTTSAAGPSPELIQKISQLEAQVIAHGKTVDALNSEKAQLQAELAAAKSGASSAGAPDAAAVENLKSKIGELEARLAEYNVIEDDLANLKRLQQENTQLKSQLAAIGAGVSTPAPAPAPSQPVAPAASQTVAPAPAAPVAAPAPPVATVAPAPVQAPPDAAATPVADPAVATPAPVPSADAAPAAVDPAALAAATPAATADPSEADLVAEFEKMIKG